ncbi:MULTISPECIES: hypothetical protein [Cyanophyceae]|uniref:hypothetical protein n=1 Tax=Cyanophyceae TaxID=3028117 RepID=UPI0016880E27|nr:MULTISPECIES: hypothetical protein [Cyanophyceae]MBD1916073.1 hypothetical protein [Phormidium sp. FACHB-77]MBD2031658.1 hypothetical protein [Phormidium sp. FACHB-322]MBD2052715.1 hypothetical protein [Leptolyngbya sp. FACHB-60]
MVLVLGRELSGIPSAVAAACNLRGSAVAQCADGSGLSNLRLHWPMGNASPAFSTHTFRMKGVA